VSVTEDECSADKGRRLEAEIARALAAGGYAARRNVVREGRSGARHEIDVLAEKGDGLTTFSVMVECKAWDRPVDKEVLAKAAFVAADVGADKTIVVALQGATGGAELSAAELGVELWGPEELERRLGRVQLAALGAARARTALGFAVAVDEARAARLAERQRSKGVLGLGAEEVAWFDLVWLPCLLLTLGCTRQEGRLHKRTRHSSVFNLYEALDGTLLESFAVDPSVAEVEVGPYRLPTRITVRTLRGKLSSTFAKWRSVVQGAARERWAQAGADLGIPLLLDALTVDEATACYLPVYVAILRQKDSRRVVVIDGGDGAVDQPLSSVLTANLSYLTEALDSPTR
jgi:Holliday junction resolvase